MGLIKGGPLSTKSEYIEDRALDSRGNDKFGHTQIALELSRLIERNPTPMHIALFGPWGSGKTSLGNILCAELNSRRDNRTVVLDAWKFGREPLKRHFILRSAQALGLRVREFEHRLYESRKRNRLELPRGDVLKTVAVFGLSLVVPIAVIAVVMVIVAWISGEGFWPRFIDLLKAYGPALLLSAGFLTTAMSVFGKLFIVDTEETPVDTDERFEHLFKALVRLATRKHKCKRIVFYVDELDRCSPAEIVEVLEVIRTFADVPGCVFVVGADRRALEEALASSAHHAVANDASNPYYSSASEYLDKTFQHQVTLPPLSPYRLTSFATELVRGRPGVWKEPESLSELISVLVPSHVRSPRRVKVLLNAFVTSYRCMARRHEQAGSFAPDPRARILELAKLTVLRQEFPLFYRHLEAQPALAGLLTDYIVGGSWSDELASRARAYGVYKAVEDYAASKRAVDALVGPDAQEKNADEAESADVVRRDQLVRYLLRTAAISGPARDMVFSESAASTLGIPAEMADLIEEDAINKDVEAAVGRLLAMDQAARLAGVRLLLSADRGFEGIEIGNALSIAVECLLRGVVEPEALSNDFAARVLEHASRESLPVHWLAPLVANAGASRNREQSRIRGSVMTDSRLRQKENTQAAVAVLAATLPHAETCVDALRDLLVDSPAGTLSDGAVIAAMSTSVLSLVFDSRTIARLEGRFDYPFGEAGTEEENASLVALGEFTALAQLAVAGHIAGLEWGLAKHAYMLSDNRLADSWVEAWAEGKHVAPSAIEIAHVLETCSPGGWALIAGAPMRLAPGDSLEDVTELVDRILQPDDASVGPNADSLVLVRLLSGMTDATSAVPPIVDEVVQSRIEASVSGVAWADAQDVLLPVVANLAQIRVPGSAKALAELYSVGVRVSQDMGEEELARLAEQLQHDWAWLSAESAPLAEALDQEPSGSGLMLRYGLSKLDGGPSFSPPDDFLSGRVAGASGPRLAAYRGWLAKQASEKDVIALSRALGSGVRVSAVRFSLAKALTRLGPEVSGRFMAVVLDRRVALDSEDMSTLWGLDVLPGPLGHCLSEHIRAARNNTERSYYLVVWSVWSPKDKQVLSLLNDALKVQAEGSQRAFEMVIANVGVLRTVPKGIRRSTVSLIRRRAKVHALEAKVDARLVAEGLHAAG